MTPQQDARRLLEALEPFARSGEVGPVTNPMYFALTAAIPTWHRFESALKLLQAEGYLFDQGKVLCFDPQGRRGERPKPRWAPLLTLSPPHAPGAPSRPSWDEMGVRTAQLWAERSADPKLKVGSCLMDRWHRVIGVGYNGRAAGEPNERESLDQGMSEALHAEINCLLAANWNGEGATLYVTSEPCASCARAIINARRISRVVYVSPYYEDARRGRDLPRGADILRDAGVEVVQWPA
ncbi:Deoxycytidylate deaminase [Deinococcus reticulitermitis]|uniref:Deoxycytidylate deaminase n=1 Tax=Deinococcus reticulitermitis TaxID=856736 RepID=A0A1H7CSR4_9DEIO|nr:deaminase [Deinococcus reticulitermitis]SEJ90212.1 Deoxycytidylate deaminase [Deinococcus reticulitermitis]